MVASGHIHHESARRWFEAREPDSVAICRVTQMGLMRLLTNPKVLPAGVYSIERAWKIAHEVLADKRVFFELEPPGLDAAWIGMMRHKTAGVSSWTDPYLAAFADGYGMRW
ncbi:MAG: VapC toxin family PIN domain ribonuclease [Terriglobia bacterium]